MKHKPKLLIGFHGKAGAGKNTAATIFQTRILRGLLKIEELAFATPVKEAASKMFGVPFSWFNDTKKKEEVIPFWGLSPRKMAQLVGTEMGRDVIGDQIWLKRMELTIDARTPAYAFITDVRFQNEIQWVINNGGYIINILRKGADGNVGVAGHRSEAGVKLNYREHKGKVFAVENDGTVLELEAKLKQIYDTLNPNRK